MRRLPKPADDALVVFRLCISRVRQAGLRARLRAIAPTVATAAVQYDAAASAALLHTIPEQTGVGNVTAAEMSTTYAQRMARNAAPGRSVYDRLMTAPTHGLCPLCGQRVVSTLDHHLPKERFSAVVVAPANLVPACADCNKLKLDVAPSTAEEQTLHPYFDDV